jgi:uncharacterized protein (DUF2384 family)
MKYTTSKKPAALLREMPVSFRPPPKAAALAGNGYLNGCFTRAGQVDVEHVADTFRMSKAQLAETVGLPLTTLTKNDRVKAPKTQGRMTEMLEIIARIKDWAGSETQAMAWYRAQPIPALDGRTAESLVKTGDAAAVRDYLDHMALGGFA